jgi:hypothetical protein
MTNLLFLIPAAAIGGFVYHINADVAAILADVLAFLPV